MRIAIMPNAHVKTGASAPKRPPVADRITLALEELLSAVQSGKPLQRVFASHILEISDPATYGAAAVRATRRRLAVSQKVFARLLGVSVELVEHWEQGIRKPQPLACRLLDEINRNPVDYLKRHVRAA